MRRMKHLEWPTLVVLAACYGLWFVSGLVVFPHFPVLALGLMTLSVILDPTQSLFAALAWVVLGGLGGLALLHPTATRRFINPDEVNLARQPR